MAHTLSIPFYGFKLNFASGGNLSLPMMHQQMVFPDITVQRMAGHFRKAFQDKVLDKGAYSTLLDQYAEGDFIQAEVPVSFRKSKDNMSFPEFELAFKYYYRPNDRGIWAVVPVLGVEAYAENEEALDKAVEEAVRLEFARKGRLKNVQTIVETIWYESVELQQQSIPLKFHSPSELARLKEEKKEEILPLVAQPLEVYQKGLFGMKKELDQLVRALKGKYGRNALLVGASGVGKTTLVWELARLKRSLRITAGIWETTASVLIKELTRSTGWQDNLAYLIRDLNRRGDILFVRNLMELFEVGQYEGNSVSMAEYLRPYLSRGEITLVSECTQDELARIELRSPNFTSLFNIIQVEEPRDDLEDIILDKVNLIAKLSKIYIEGEAVKETLRLNKRYTPYSGFPGKPIRFLEGIILNYQRQRKQDAQKTGEQPPVSIGRSEVIRYFCEETGMPRFMVDPEVPMQPKRIRTDFKGDLYGQDHAVDAVVDLLAAVKTGLTRPGKPIASLLFVGPTGVGKTEMAKILAQFMFGGRDKIIRFDMSEFSDPYSVIRLTGAGYHSEGLLTAAARREPFAVILFDEIEKAHPSFYDLLLQVLGEGRLSDGAGKLVNFCSSIIIMTSNIGAQSLQTHRIGWNSGVSREDVNTHFVSAVEKHFRPELFNRIDRLIPFGPLDQDTMRFVVEREMTLFKRREGVKFRKLGIRIEDEVLDYISIKGYDSQYGARFLQRAMRERLVTPLAKQLNQYEYTEQLEVEVVMRDGGIAINVDADPMKMDLMLEELQRDNSTDLASKFRRNAYQLQAGGVYVKLLSELDMLESKKRKKGEAFWKNPKNGETYSYYLNAKKRMDELTREIEELEMELSLAVMELKPYRPDIIREMKDWEKAYEEMKVELFVRLNPEYNTCHIALTGNNILHLLAFYREIIALREFDVVGMKSLWLRESYYYEQVVKNEGTSEEKKEARTDYVHRDFDPDNPQDARPEKGGDLLCGIILQLKGPAVYVYFQPEAGRVDWVLPDKKRANFYVQVETREPNYPKDVHRKDFFTRKVPRARRVVAPLKISDTEFRIKRDLPKGNHVEFIKGELDKRFTERLDGELMGE